MADEDDPLAALSEVRKQIARAQELSAGLQETIARSKALMAQSVELTQRTRDLFRAMSDLFVGDDEGQDRQD